MDIVVAQGSEAGGHRGHFNNQQSREPLIGTMSLIPQIVDHVSIPVVRRWCYGWSWYIS